MALFYWPVQRGELQGVWVCVVLCPALGARIARFARALEIDSRQKPATRCQDKRVAPGTAKGKAARQGKNIRVKGGCGCGWCVVCICI